MVVLIYTGFPSLSQPNKDEQNIIYDASSISEKQYIYLYQQCTLRTIYSRGTFSLFALNHRYVLIS